MYEGIHFKTCFIKNLKKTLRSEKKKKKYILHNFGTVNIWIGMRTNGHTQRFFMISQNLILLIR